MRKNEWFFDYHGASCKNKAGIRNKWGRIYFPQKQIRLNFLHFLLILKQSTRSTWGSQQKWRAQVIVIKKEG